MNAATIARALAGIAVNVRRRGPSPAQWVEAFSVLAKAPTIPGHYRHVRLEPGRAFVTLHRFPSETSAQ